MSSMLLLSGAKTQTVRRAFIAARCFSSSLGATPAWKLQGDASRSGQNEKDGHSQINAQFALRFVKKVDTEFLQFLGNQRQENSSERLSTQTPKGLSQKPQQKRRLSAT
eukprot:TRINITY_DN100593_c0_g1_i1.p1 TRINITY_DN100593_c0_g1~~TRINITY_DN100593_c0_g1_i1.p1  ORF type:complete len:109 (+),score=8.67 TRINITY_DN100593_c0_g1_i1:94-420(+)